MKCFWDELDKILLEEERKNGVRLKIEDVEIGGKKLSVEELKKKYKLRVNKIKVNRNSNINVTGVKFGIKKNKE